MQAIVQTGYGAPERVLTLAEIPRPRVAADAVLIRVKATSVNTPDWIAVAGVPYVLRLQSGLRGPSTPVRGTDVAGVVEEVGRDVTDLRAGRRGVRLAVGERAPDARARHVRRAHGRPGERGHRKPAGLSFEEAGAAGMSGLTALLMMRDAAGVGPGTRVLINGASGGVGTFAVQIAKTLGAQVTGVCSTRNVELVRSLGADHVIDYTQQDFTRGGERYDVILDNVLNHPPAATARALAPVRDPHPEQRREHGRPARRPPADGAGPVHAIGRRALPDLRREPREPRRARRAPRVGAGHGS